MVAMSPFKVSFYLYREAGAVISIVRAHTGHEDFDEL
jgi:hypothetical protein